jgi:hypothetical protein
MDKLTVFQVGSLHPRESSQWPEYVDHLLCHTITNTHTHTHNHQHTQTHTHTITNTHTHTHTHNHQHTHIHTHIRHTYVQTLILCLPMHALSIFKIFGQTKANSKFNHFHENSLVEVATWYDRHVKVSRKIYFSTYE